MCSQLTQCMHVLHFPWVNESGKTPVDSSITGHMHEWSKEFLTLQPRCRQTYSLVVFLVLWNHHHSLPIIVCDKVDSAYCKVVVWRNHTEEVGEYVLVTWKLQRCGVWYLRVQVYSTVKKLSSLATYHRKAVVFRYCSYSLCSLWTESIQNDNRDKWKWSR